MGTCVPLKIFSHTCLFQFEEGLRRSGLSERSTMSYRQYSFAMGFCFKYSFQHTVCSQFITISSRRTNIIMNITKPSAVKLIYDRIVHASNDTAANWTSDVQIQSTLVISNSKGLSEILRESRTSTYQICRIGEKVIPLTSFNKYMCNWTFEVTRDILKILWKRGEIAPQEQFLLFSTIFLHVVRFSYLCRDQIFTSR